jgi:hypothetical protein
MVTAASSSVGLEHENQTPCFSVEGGAPLDTKRLGKRRESNLFALPERYNPPR